MKLKIGNLKLTILLALLAVKTFGFEATLSLQPPLIQLGESASLSIEVRGAKNPSPPILPSVPGLRFVSTGQSTQMNWINGKSDHFTAFNYTVYPQQTGTFTIPSFEYTFDGKTEVLQAATLNVVGTSGDAQQAQSWSDLIFARLDINRTNVYVQEPFRLTLSIYSRQGLQMAGNVSLTGMPETGLDGLQWQEVQGGRDMISNVVYDIRRFQTRTRAMSSGVFEFHPIVSVQVALPNQNTRSPFGDPFFSSMFQRTETRPVDLSIEKTSLTVKPLPVEGRPAGFSGAVGQFNFHVTAHPLKVHPGDPITLKMIISGNGNFDRITPPALPSNGTSFRLFGDAIRTQQENRVQFEQVISPRTAEAKEIPALPFSFFDTQSGSYRTVNSQPISLTVTATSNNTAQVFAAKDSVVLPPPETPFATTSDLQRIESWVKAVWKHIRPWLWALPTALMLGLLLFATRIIRKNRRSDTARVRRQKAPKAARKALRTAGHSLRKGNLPAFYDSLWNALADYFGHRLNLPPGDVTAQTVLAALGRSGLDPEQINQLHAIFDLVESSRYGLPPEESSFDHLKSLQIDLERILKQCERRKI